MSLVYSSPDAKLRDYENIPFLQKDKVNGEAGEGALGCREGNLIPQTIEEYFEWEVKPLRSLAEIKPHILKAE